MMNYETAMFKNAVDEIAKITAKAGIDVCVGYDGLLTMYDKDSEFQTGNGVDAETAFRILKAKADYKELTKDWI